MQLFQVEVCLAATPLVPDAGCLVLSARGPSPGCVVRRGGVDDLRRVDAEEIEVAGVAGAVLVPGRGRQIDTAFSVVALGPGLGMLQPVMVAAVRLHPRSSGLAALGRIVVVERGVVVEIGIPGGRVTVQPLAHAAEDANPGVEHRTGLIDVGGNRQRFARRRVNVGIGCVLGNADGTDVGTSGDLARMVGIDQSVSV